MLRVLTIGAGDSQDHVIRPRTAEQNIKKAIGARTMSQLATITENREEDVIALSMGIEPTKFDLEGSYGFSLRDPQHKKSEMRLH